MIETDTNRDVMMVTQGFVNGLTAALTTISKYGKKVGTTRVLEMIVNEQNNLDMYVRQEQWNALEEATEKKVSSESDDSTEGWVGVPEFEPVVEAIRSHLYPDGHHAFEFIDCGVHWKVHVNTGRNGENPAVDLTISTNRDTEKNEHVYGG